MIGTECPNKKVITSRFFISFFISYASLFIFLYAVLSFLQISRNVLLILIAVLPLYLLIQLVIRGFDYYCEFKASGANWKKPKQINHQAIAF